MPSKEYYLYCSLLKTTDFIHTSFAKCDSFISWATKSRALFDFNQFALQILQFHKTIHSASFWGCANLGVLHSRRERGNYYDTKRLRKYAGAFLRLGRLLLDCQRLAGYFADCRPPFTFPTQHGNSARRYRSYHPIGGGAGFSAYRCRHKSAGVD